MHNIYIAPRKRKKNPLLNTINIVTLSLRTVAAIYHDTLNNTNTKPILLYSADSREKRKQILDLAFFNTPKRSQIACFTTRMKLSSVQFFCTSPSSLCLSFSSNSYYSNNVLPTPTNTKNRTHHKSTNQPEPTVEPFNFVEQYIQR